MENGLINKNYYLEKIESIKKCLPGDSDVLELEKKVREKLEEFRPYLMVYGIYNSGKSTLINALFGRDVAEVDDVPKTDKVQKYEINGVIIYDTPGIDAPIEHERVTEEHLKKCEVVLFVMSSDASFEERKVYEKIIEILKMNKKVIIVLNNKSGVDNKEGQRMLNRIEGNLIKVMNETGFKSDNIESYFVNLKSALKAKKENKELLLEKSGIRTLEQAIVKAAMQSKENILTTVENLISNFISDKIESLSNQIEDAVLKEKERVPLSIRKGKERVKYEAFALIEKKIIDMREKIRSLLLENTDSYTLENYIRKEILEIQNEISNKLQQSSEFILGEVNLTIKKLEELENQLGGEDSGIGEYIESGLKVLKNKEVTQKGLYSLLLKLREFKVPGIKGRWKRTLTKWAGKWAQRLVVIFSIVEIGISIKKQMDMEKELRENMIRANSLAREITNEIENNLKSFIEEAINESYGPIEEQLETEILSLKSEKNEVTSRIDCLKSVGL
ncbi:GTPase [Hippea sp. KM1]|uniref:GTPase n=1 Tax=Hippea sp. KM1 TaxID=944481 RepID=UPI00046CFEF1|nr:GTPase [Hippea sp. KM1]